MEEVVLLLGSNLGNSLGILQKAVEMINERVGEVIKKSSIYQSKPWGFEHDNNFLNQIILINTEKGAEKLLELILEIEHDLGRIREGKSYKARTIDIDIIYYNEKVLNLENLKIPHPLLQERMFTLAPLVEILPHFIHPVFKESNLELLKKCPDNSEVTKIQ